LIYFILKFSFISTIIAYFLVIAVQYWKISIEFEKYIIFFYYKLFFKIINSIFLSFKRYYSLESNDLKDIKNYYNNQRGFFWVAENQDNSEIIGHIALDLTCLDLDNSVELRRCAVSSKYRQKGVGKLLVEHLIKIAKTEFNASSVFLTTSTIQLSAIKLYKKCGFHITYLKMNEFMFNVKVIKMIKFI